MRHLLVILCLFLAACGPSKDERDVQESLSTLRVGDKWPAPEHIKLVESNEKWDKYYVEYSKLTTRWGVFYTIDKTGTVLSIYRKL